MTEKTINVATAFTVIVDPDGQGNRPVTVPAGVQKVPAEIADHWYTQLHLAHGGFGTPEYAAAARAAADNAFHEADAAVKKYQSLEDAVGDAEDAAGVERTAPAHIRLRPAEQFEPTPAPVEPTPATAAAAEPAPVEPAPDDTTTAPAAADSLQGGAGEDSITGGETSTDTLTGGQGDDTLTGSEGADTITGTEGADTVTGGEAADATNPHPNLTPAQEQALDRDGDGSAGGAPAGGNKPKKGSTKPDQAE